MRIYKYPVPIEDNFVIEMPFNAEILSFQVQYGLPMIWAAVWHESSLEERNFSLRGTGHDIDIHLVKKFIGTVQLIGGDTVLHLFEMN